MASVPVPADAPAGCSVPDGLLASLCEPGGAGLYIADDAPLLDAVTLFEDNRGLRLLPVVDAAMRPTGALFEEDIRGILYNPFGHSLLRNPRFGSSVAAHRRACPTGDVLTPTAKLLEHYAEGAGTEGLILTRHGRLLGVLSNRTLVGIAAAREASLVKAREARLERMAGASDAFLADIAALARSLSVVAHAVEEAAGEMADRAVLHGRRATAVTDASARTTAGMIELADQGSGLAATFDRVREETIAASAAAAEAVVLVEDGSRRATELTGSTRAIDANIGQINAIATKSHLLAINAAIEAARVGVDGSGFSVVARELRQFAEQTRKAAGAITGRVNHIRTIADEISDGQRGMQAVIGTVDSLSRSIDTALGAQLSTARLVADNVEHAVGNAGVIGDQIGEIARLADQAMAGSTQMRGLAARVAREAGAVETRVSAYVAEVGAA